MDRSFRRRDVLRMGLTTGAGLLLPQALSGCCPCHVRSEYAWNNALALDGVDPEQELVPASLGELVAIVQQAERQQRRIRMTGSGHSFSDVAFSEDYLLRPEKLALPLELDTSQLAAGTPSPEHLVRVQSGMRLRELNPWLWRRGLSLCNMGGYDAQTIVGAAITGTHGSSLSHGPIAAQIQSLQVVTTGGEVLQVEPTAGITDPSKFPGQLATSEGSVPLRLVQDDHVFHAVTVSMGCMGVVYAVVLRVEPRYWLKELRIKTTWGALTQSGGFLQRLLNQQKLDDGDGVDPEYYEIYVNPYPSKRGKPAASHACLLTKRYKLHDEPTHLSVDQRRRGRWGVGALEAANILTGNGEALVDFMNAHAGQVPAILDGAIDALVDDKAGFIDINYDVFNLGPPNHTRAYGIEVAFDLAQSIQATERLFQHAAELRERGFMHSSPPSLRFVKPAEAWLAMQYGRPTMMLEMGMLVCANGSDELLESYERMYMEEFAARPHWGLDLNTLTSFAEVQRLYPQSADSWLAVYRAMNSKGTFNARFTDRLQISTEL